MTALLRYQTALLLRSQRWLAPFLVYAAFVGVGVNAGEPVLGALGYTVAGLVPVAAWTVRVCLNQEPPAARAVTAAAAVRTRAHLAAILTATACTLVVGAAAVLTVTAMSEHRTVAPLPAAFEGLLAATTCALTGTALGTLTTRPLIPSRGWSLTTLLIASLLAVVTTGSPAKTAIATLITATPTPTLTHPWLPLAGALTLATGAAWLGCRATGWRE